MPKSILHAAELPTILIIPSGIGCSVGGYAGDAIPAARLLAAVSGCLITHPNVMNGGSLYWRDNRIQYVEGYSLDQFSTGEISLRPVRKQKVGLLLDAGMDEESKQRHIQVAEGCRATLGLDVGPILKTDIPLGVNPFLAKSGASWGQIAHPDSLLRAGEALKDLGATAIAVVTHIPELTDISTLNDYRHGNGVDPIAGVEALISHLLVRHLKIPCAHAPAMNSLPVDVNLDPRAVGEEIGYTFLPSVLVGLHKAPDLLIRDKAWTGQKNDLSIIDIEDVGAVVAPHGALGGESVLACLGRGVSLISVANPSVLHVDQESLEMKQLNTSKTNRQVFNAHNYVEAAGLLSLLREGINVDSLYRPFHKIE